jgi:hypothetical protein
MFAMNAMLTRRPNHLKMPRLDAYAQPPNAGDRFAANAAGRLPPSNLRSGTHRCRSRARKTAPLPTGIRVLLT